MSRVLESAPPTERPHDDHGPEVTILMPCLNEARTVGACIGKARRCLEQLGVGFEILVADNGSTDGSPEIALGLGARVIHIGRRGYGNALLAGIAASNGRYIIMGDADDSYDFSRVGPFIERLREGDDLVMGNRFRGGIRPGAMPWLHRYVGNPVLTGALNLFFRSPIGDAHCGLRGFRKASCQRLGLTSPGMEFASEMVVKACLDHQRISEVPVVLHPDGRDRRPHLRSFRDGWRHLRLLLMFCPLWLYLVPAGTLLAIGLGLMVWLTRGPRSLGPVTLDLHSMLFGALCLIVGYQTLWLWAFARIFGWTSGLLPRDILSVRLFNHFNLERGLLIGAGLLLAGVALHAWLVWIWYDRNFGNMDVSVTMRFALWGLTTMVLGVQTVFGSFIVSMMGLAPGAHARSD